MGTIHESSIIDIRYSVRITDTPYIKDETTDKVTEGTPIITTEDRSGSITVKALLELFTNSFAIENTEGVYNSEHLVAGFELTGEFSDTDEKRHEVVLATDISIKDSMGGGYTQIKSVKTTTVSNWKTIICQGGRRGTFTEETKLPVFRTGELSVADIDAGSVLLCDENGDLSLSVVLLTRQVANNATACSIVTASGTYDSGGFSLASV